MILVRVTNCKHRGRANQNTTFVFGERDWGFDKGDIVTNEWVLDNLENIQKIGIEKQKNTRVEIEQR